VAHSDGAVADSAAPSPLAPSETPAPTVAELDAQENALEQQRAAIDQKLAAIAALRGKITGVTTPSASAPATPENGPVPGGNGNNGGEAQTPSSQFSIHGQTTVITQVHDKFPSPYVGPNSLVPDEGMATSITSTLFMGRHVWSGGSLYLNPEISGGDGFSGVSGIAGFTNGETPRIGSPTPTPYVARLYLQQVFGLGGEKEQIAEGPNQVAESVDIHRLTVTAGKFAASDFFQQSAYANDPRGQFQNWTLFTEAAWDYPANTRGYTQGVILELNNRNHSLRYGAMAEPAAANGPNFDSKILDALGNSLEYEARWMRGDHPGSAKLMGYLNRADMGNYAEAIAGAGSSAPNVISTRAYRDKYGIAFTGDQELSPSLGAFARLGWNDGRSESWAFTEIDRNATTGINLKGTHWGRPDDVVGFAGSIEGLSNSHRQYLADGGLGFIIGDGKLPNYETEEILEAYYNAKVSANVFVTPDVQFVNNPAYNADRGPVLVGALRVHTEF